MRAGIAERGRAGTTADYAASRGEFLNGLLLARCLGYEFVDAAELIRFDDRGRLDEGPTYARIAERLTRDTRAVVPGFYGSDPAGGVKTFSRGGSDVSGAILARGVHAELYENWTDVSGLLMTDPRIVDNPRTIDRLTYRELRELSYSGATVLHDMAVFPVRQAGIPVQIRNTNRPEDPGTQIVADTAGDMPGETPGVGTITGIAGRRDFTIITVDKAMMNTEIGFGRKLLSSLESMDISFEHLPSGIDTMSVVVADAELIDKLDDVLDSIRQACKPDAIEVDPNLALIATVGRGMKRIPGMAATLFAALAEREDQRSHDRPGLQRTQHHRRRRRSRLRGGGEGDLCSL